MRRLATYGIIVVGGFMLLLSGVFIQRLWADLFVTGHDTVVKTGRPTKLTAKIERKIISYLAPNLKGVELCFYLGQQEIGKAVSDQDGIAHLPYTPLTVGMHTISYQIKGKSSRYRAGRLFAVSGTRPAVVTDIDGTISNYPDWEVPLGGAKAPTFPYAPEFLRKLADGYDIIYLTARDDALDVVTMAFLNHHQFPEGAVLYNEWGMRGEKRRQMGAKHAAGFKLRMIKFLQEAGIIVVAGIGNSATDVEAYSEAGIDSYIRKDPKQSIANPKASILFANYQELEGIFAAKHAQYQELARRLAEDKK